MAKKREVVVITGASAGVGRATVREFARHGCDIGLIARGKDRLEAAKREVEELGGRAVAIPCDVADAAALEAAAEQIERELGPIDIWVNNAMVSVFSPVKRMQADEYRRVTEVTYLGVVHGTLAALKRMLPRNQGTIVQIGSALAYRSIPLQSAYCAAKHAIVGFTDSLRCELIHDQSNIHLTVAHLPAVNTPQFEWSKSRMPRHPQPVPPIFEPEVIARGIYFAAHARRRELWIGFPTVKAIVGQRLAAGYADRYLAKNGYDSQMTSEPVSPNRPDNLWQPAPGAFAAHGTFDEQARKMSWQLKLNTHRGALAAALVGIGAGIIALLGRDEIEKAAEKVSRELKNLRQRAA
ncbi:MAG TPA: SDR family oxidoreductase [Terriglobales bacterium]|nr:SDR family oxidoreductase [Terriglobales bacterium]